MTLVIVYVCVKGLSIFGHGRGGRDIVPVRRLGRCGRRSRHGRCGRRGRGGLHGAPAPGGRSRRRGGRRCRRRGGCRSGRRLAGRRGTCSATRGRACGCRRGCRCSCRRGCRRGGRCSSRCGGGGRHRAYRRCELFEYILLGDLIGWHCAMREGTGHRGRDGRRGLGPGRRGGRQDLRRHGGRQDRRRRGGLGRNSAAAGSELGRGDAVRPPAAEDGRAGRSGDDGRGRNLTAARGRERDMVTAAGLRAADGQSTGRGRDGRLSDRLLDSVRGEQLASAHKKSVTCLAAN